MEKTDKSKHYEINSNIDKMLERTMFHANETFEKHNAKVSKAFEIYYNDSDTDDEKKEAYNRFCKDLKTFNKIIPIPKYDKYQKMLEDMDFLSQ